MAGIESEKAVYCIRSEQTKFESVQIMTQVQKQNITELLLQF